MNSSKPFPFTDSQIEELSAVTACPRCVGGAIATLASLLRAYDASDAETRRKIVFEQIVPAMKENETLLGDATLDIRRHAFKAVAQGFKADSEGTLTLETPALVRADRLREFMEREEEIEHLHEARRALSLFIQLALENADSPQAKTQ